MPDDQILVPVTPPVGTPAPGTPPVGAPAVPPTGTPVTPPDLADGKPIGITSQQLKERLVEAKSAGKNDLLAMFGFKTEVEAKGFFDTARSLMQAQMTETEKAAARAKELEQQLTELPMLRTVVATMAEREFNSLTETQRAAVDKHANGDPLQRLNTINMLREFLPVQTPTAPVQPPLPAPPTTSAPGAAPPPPASTKTKFEEWQELETNPKKRFEATFFFNRHRAEIERTRPA